MAPHSAQSLEQSRLHLVPGAGWIAMMVFLAELALGLAYAWKKGALEWE
jgi:NADH-quinone oxidoreductase subunit A